MFSEDPRRAAILARISFVIRHLPRGSVVLFMDEKGPITVKRYGGYRWTREKRVVLRTYPPTRGKYYLFAAYELFHGRVRWKFHERSRSVEFIKFMQQVRRWYPHQYILVILDADTPHPQHCVASRQEMRRLKIHWLSLPKGSPDDNPLETVFGVLQDEVLVGSAPRDVADQQRQMSRALQRRNRRKDRFVRLKGLDNFHKK